MSSVSTVSSLTSLSVDEVGDFAHVGNMGLATKGSLIYSLEEAEFSITIASSTSFGSGFAAYLFGREAAGLAEGVMIDLRGFCTPNGRWNEQYSPPSVSISIRFVFTAMEDDLILPDNFGNAPSGTNNTTAARLVASVNAAVDFEGGGGGSAPGFLASAATNDGREFTRTISRSTLGQPVNISFDSGGAAISSIVNTGDSSVFATPTDYAFNISGSQITFNASRMDILKGRPVGATATWNVFVAGDPVPFVLTWQIIA
jgi:hypothetical protein